jgi:hypothetical protein
VKDHLDLDLLIEGILQMKQSSGGGELVQSRANLLAVLQPNNGQDGAA